MSVYLRGRVYWYKFQIDGRPYRGTTRQHIKSDAEEFEDELKRKIRRRRGGLPALPEHAPRFAEWAEIYYAHVVARGDKRPDRTEILLRVILRFFGARPSGANPKNPPIEGEPYHDLRLSDPVVNPQWILDFETWMKGRNIGPQSRNQYRSVVSGMYKLAVSDLHRQVTGLLVNPFHGIHRDRAKGRTVVLTIDEVRRVLLVASYHVRLAISIALLAPKFRLANILDLRWSTHVTLGARQVMVGKVPRTIYGWITVDDHKTDEYGDPLVTPVSKQLYDILVDAQRRSGHDAVVTYRGAKVKSIRSGVRAACRRAGVPYGRFLAGGATFHTIRHSANTAMAELDITETKRQKAAGHRDLATTQHYTHLRPVAEIEPLETLSESLPIADLVTEPWKRAGARRVSTSVPTRH